jgi:hypothetical protein
MSFFGFGKSKKSKEDESQDEFEDEFEEPENKVENKKEEVDVKKLEKKKEEKVDKKYEDGYRNENKDEKTDDETKDENKNEESDNEEEISQSPINRFGKLLDLINGKKYRGGLYKISVSQLCKIAYHHPFNRKLNKTHIEEIKNGIIEDEMLTSTIKLIVDRNDDVYLLDGHHRYNALLSLNKKSKEAFDMSLYIEVYNVNEHDDEEVVELFKKANNIKKMSLDDSPIIAISEALKKCVIKFPDMFKDKQDDKSVYRPRVNRNIVYNAIRDSKIISKYNLTSTDIFNIIVYINNLLSKKPKSFFGSDVKATHYEKAQDNGFYLGLKKKNDIYDWLNCLDLYVNEYKKKMKGIKG